MAKSALLHLPMIDLASSDRLSTANSIRQEMDIPEHRIWMYKRTTPYRGGLTDEFVYGVESFIAYVCARPHFQQDGERLRCPCVKCQCKKFLQVDDVKVHLYKKGFMAHYYYWTCHGEEVPSLDTRVQPEQVTHNDMQCDNDDFPTRYERMVMDAAGPSIRSHREENEEEDPNADAQDFYQMLENARTPVYDGCTTHTELSTALRMLSIKADWNVPEQCYNAWVQLMNELIPNSNRLPKNFYRTKKMVSKLGLGYQKIDCCVNGCMLYFKDDSNANECKFCHATRYIARKVGHGRYKKVPMKRMWYLPLTPRLQRLYASSATAGEMRWHYENPREPGVLSHPSDGEAWKHFDEIHPDFAREPRNVRLGLCTDGFTPYGMSGKTYSCWPVIVTPYNLPPWMCMRQEYLFLTIIIPGPCNPKNKIDVFLQPLIDELNMLWDVGVPTYDISQKQNFQMRAALMWTINDFPAYGMLSGWMTAGKLACPCCMENSKAFTLKHGRKTSFFDCHRQFLPMNHPFRRNRDAFIKNKVEKVRPPPLLSGDEIWGRVRALPKITETASIRTQGYGLYHNWTRQSIFWELPYWRTNLIRHNLDVMHIEKNVFDNVFNTVMDVKAKTKDNIKARMDLKEYCRRKELELVEQGNGKYLKPRARYALDIEQRRAVCEWVCQLKLPDGNASNLSRCVDMREAKLHGMKSHDCHIFMERLLPIALRALPDPIWKPLAELSQFFREICCSSLQLDKLEILEENIKVTICKLEQIFPPGFFNPMEHLPIHLAHEARLGGPVQYRWMYPFERFLHTLKRKVKNKARVEGSICEAYITEETSTFCSHYFETDVPSRRTRVGRNDDSVDVAPDHTTFSIFNHSGRPSGASKDRLLNDRELDRATLYVLLNCDEVQPYINAYVDSIKEDIPHITEMEVDKRIEIEFPKWFKEYVHDPTNEVHDQQIRDISWGPLRKVRTWPIYFVNGYKFHTASWNQDKSTINNGVCTRRTVCGQPKDDYYSILQEVIRLEYPGLPIKQLVLFNCEWFDPTIGRGTRIHHQYRIVEVRSTRKYNRYDPFILASQAHQVYYAPYPSQQRNLKDWWVVIRAKARSTIDAPTIERATDAYQADDDMLVQPNLGGDEQIETLRDEASEPEWVDEYSNDHDVLMDDEGLDDEEVEDEEIEDEEEDEFDDEQSEDEVNEDQSEDEVDAEQSEDTE